MIDKLVPSLTAAMAGIEDGATVLVAGFGAGIPDTLLRGLLAQGARDLTLVVNAAASEEGPVSDLMAAGRVRKVVCSFVRAASTATKLHREGRLEIEMVPQGTLAERIRAGGAGIPGFYTPTAADTVLAEGRETRVIGGKLCLLEHAIEADVALVDAWEADRWGNLTHRATARNFNPVMAMAGRLTIVQTRHVVPLGTIPPQHVHTAGVFVDRVLHVPEGEAA
ncbi:MAG: 3-oxoadipate CoA-transferase [Rhodospirillales bacterium 69-11]|nr:3-oxoacid CoA-transferase subunit A [Rhodospirillales bacterium]MBN8927341.1 3-oxoacid CoA-transferase subunit A [Rhodospirillales bacterium]OJW27085.1 MAG: 3-oxoadipate CoA-transferase [Rhodospirillales bacterium 69-11]